METGQIDGARTEEMRKIDIWKLVSETGIPDKLVVDPLKVLYFDRVDGCGMFDEKDQHHHDKSEMACEDAISKLDTALNEEQKALFDKVLCALIDKQSVEVFSSYKYGFRDGRLVEFNTFWGPLVQLAREVNQAKDELNKVRQTASELDEKVLCGAAK